MFCLRDDSKVTNKHKQTQIQTQTNTNKHKQTQIQTQKWPVVENEKCEKWMGTRRR
jgi:hypothetical protein